MQTEINYSQSNVNIERIQLKTNIIIKKSKLLFESKI